MIGHHQDQRDQCHHQHREHQEDAALRDRRIMGRREQRGRRPAGPQPARSAGR
jgi:hypothetical protein